MTPVQFILLLQAEPRRESPRPLLCLPDALAARESAFSR
jgi:hypothetical protein